ncbi:MAG: hypothetical protein IPN69_03100 [Acidobacteria bacterium]|nr:hypothetical protein [Acidobacteriota bacterium]
MAEDRDYFKLLTKKTLKEATRIPTLDEVVSKQWKSLHAHKKDELLSIGRSLNQGDLWVTQAERENHFWVLGSTGEGKSRFLEYLIRKDIDRLKADAHLSKNKRRSCSLCFIDPTPQGKIAHNVLNYCASIGFKKVFLIDAHQISFSQKVPCINPIDYNYSNIVDSVDYLKDAFRVLFEVEDESKTAYITTYLTAIFTILHYAGLTLRELIYFTMPFVKGDQESIQYAEKREEIYLLVERRLQSIPLQHRDIVKKHLSELRFAFSNIPNFTREFGSTARRINTLVNNPNLTLILGHRRGIKIDKLISDGWVLLVNASTGGGLGTLQTRLLATIVINQLIQSIERMRHNGFDKPFYLYLDEAQQYATDKLVEVLNTKRNIKLRMILSNHYPSQFKPKVMKSVESQTKTKIAFYVEDNTERKNVASQFYGGSIPINQVEYALRQQQKRQAVMKLGKDGAVIAKTHEVPDAKIDKQFLTDLISSNNYATINEIFEDYDDRFPTLEGAEGTSSGKTHDRKTANKANVPGTGSKDRVRKGVKKPPETPETGTIKI